MLTKFILIAIAISVTFIPGAGAFPDENKRIDERKLENNQQKRGFRHKQKSYHDEISEMNIEQPPADDYFGYENVLYVEDDITQCTLSVLGIETRVNAFALPLIWELFDSAGNYVKGFSDYAMGYEEKNFEICLAPGDYEFVFRDVSRFGNGFCNNDDDYYGFDDRHFTDLKCGYVKLSLNGAPPFFTNNGGWDVELRHTFTVPSLVADISEVPSMSPSLSPIDVTSVPSLKVDISEVPSFSPSVSPPDSTNSDMSLEGSYEAMFELMGISSSIPSNAAGLIPIANVICDSIFELMTYKEMICLVLQINGTLITAPTRTRMRRLNAIDGIPVHIELVTQTSCEGTGCAIDAMTAQIGQIANDFDVYLTTNSSQLASTITTNAQSANVQPLTEVTAIGASYNSSVSVHVTEVPIMDEWTIEFKDSKFGGNASDIMDGLFLNYFLGKGKTPSQLMATIYDESCKVKSVDTIIEAKSTAIEVQPNLIYDVGVVEVDFDGNTIEQSIYWTNLSDTSGLISFCIKSELTTESDDANEGDLSISFSETKVYTTVNFEAGFASFEIDDITVIRNNATEVVQETGYEIVACVCDETLTCNPSPLLSQNSKLVICATPSSTEVEIVKFQSVVIYQDGIAKFIPIKDGVDKSVTKSTPGAIGVVETRLVSNLFESEEPEPLVIRGEVMLDFVPQRKLFGRVLDDGSQSQASFKVEVDIEKSTGLFSSPLMAFGFICTAFGLGVVIFRNKNGNVSYNSLESHEF